MLHSNSSVLSTERNRHRAFSLIEILVVISIVALLLGLTLAAVQKVRAAADRTRCLNNLRQIGLALHGYHDSNFAFPSGVSSDSGQKPMPFVSWNARILPFLERSEVWRDTELAFASDPDFLHDPPHTWLNQVMPPFVCPSEELARRPGRFAAFTDYLGIEGTDQYQKDGMLFFDSHVRIADVTDGTSHTLLVGERPPHSGGELGWWYAGWGQDKDGSIDMVLGAREYNATSYGPGCSRGPFAYGPGRQENICDVFHFWSQHSGGAHFLAVDGSVSFRSYSIDPILPALTTRAGGEVFDD